MHGQAEIELDPTSIQRHELLASVQSRLERFLAERSTADVLTKGQLPSLPLGDAFPPERGVSIESICDRVFEGAVPPGLDTANGGHFGFVPGGGLYSGAVAGLIADVVNRYAASRSASPGAADIERDTLAGLARWMGLPQTAGIFTSGGSMSTLAALCAAREKLAVGRAHDAVVYCSEDTHFSFEKAARIVGVRRDSVRRVRVDSYGRMDVDQLRVEIVRDRVLGRIPLAVCGNAGTASVGAIDPLMDIALLARQEGLWFHVDAAYGGVFCALPELRERFSGIELADSVVVDPHKGMFLSYGVGVLLVRDPLDLRRAFAYFDADAGATDDAFEHGPELTRGWRGLRVWFPLMLHGRRAFETAWRARLSWARSLRERLSRRSGFVVFPGQDLSLLAFRWVHPRLDASALNLLNRALIQRLNASGRAFFSGATVSGETFVRVCISHLRTDVRRVAEAERIIAREAEVLHRSIEAHLESQEGRAAG